MATHPSKFVPGKETAKALKPKRNKTDLPEIPREGDATIQAQGKEVKLTNLAKIFWPEEGITKADLLQYYADVSPYLLPHLVSRAMVLKRYPNGAFEEFFFQKKAPSSKPDWVPVCEILHPSANLVNFPVINDLAGLLWVVNLGCIDLNPWYAQCDDVDRPDYMHFDLDPTPGADFPMVEQAALALRHELDSQKVKSYAKTTGSRGIHVYVPIVRGPSQKDVWTVAKAFALSLVQKYPDLMESEYRIAKRKAKRVLVDYNQNAWGRTLASVYSVRPKPLATVSAPVSWEELERGVKIEDFRIDNMKQRLAEVGDLFKPLLIQKGRLEMKALQ